MRNRKYVVNERVERWRREDAAPRLANEVPSLRSLRLVLKDVRADIGVPGKERIQHVVVARAGALFEVPCSDPKCQDGGYDVTHDILRSLKLQRESFEGSAQCRGMVGEHACPCTLLFVGHAVYAHA